MGDYIDHISVEDNHSVVESIASSTSASVESQHNDFSSSDEDCTDVAVGISLHTPDQNRSAIATPHDLFSCEDTTSQSITSGNDRSCDRLSREGFSRDYNLKVGSSTLNGITRDETLMTAEQNDLFSSTSRNNSTGMNVNETVINNGNDSATNQGSTVKVFLHHKLKQENMMDNDNESVKYPAKLLAKLQSPDLVNVILHQDFVGFEGNKSTLFANITQQSNRGEINIMSPLHNPYYDCNLNLNEVYDSDPEDIEEFKGRKKYLIHDYVESGSAIFVSFDIETGGEYCGILQISAECFKLDTDVTEYGGIRFSDTFNSYVKPSESAIWSDHTTKIHGLHKGHPSIIHAYPLELVWKQFISYLNVNIPIGK